MDSNRGALVTVVAADISPNTGEGFLAISLIRLLRQRFEVCIYRDLVIRGLRSNRFARDRILPLYLVCTCALLRLLRRKVILLNYVPAWNFLQALLTHIGVILGPITGSASVIPTRPTAWQTLTRRWLQGICILLTRVSLSTRQVYWCATPSVHRALTKRHRLRCSFAFPYLREIAVGASNEIEYDIFIYSTKHPIKNHPAAVKFVELCSAMSYRIIFVGDNNIDKNSNVDAYRMLEQSTFDDLLSRSALYISFSNEDSGITGFKALAMGVPVLCPAISGLGYALNTLQQYYYDDPYDTGALVEKVEEILKSTSIASDARQSRIECFVRWQIEAFNVAEEWADSI